MVKPKPFFRVVQYLPLEKIREFQAMPVLARLEWLEQANDLLYKTYLSSGNREPYEPRNWPFD